jgi:copper transport protein
VAVDWAHAVAASAWTGGLIVLALLMPRREPGWPPTLLGTVARRFSRLAGACLLIVVLTGVHNAWAQLGAVSALWSSAYGLVLVAKLLLAGVLVWLGAINRYMIVPRLHTARSPRGLGARIVRASRFMILGRIRLAGATVPSRFSRYLVREAVLVVAVFAATAALGEATPPRKLATRVGDKERRQSIDVGKAADFALPPGSSERGREVFSKLERVDCHTTPDERFHPPDDQDRPWPASAAPIRPISQNRS